jgi:hypothetical protein
LGCENGRYIDDGSDAGAPTRTTLTVASVWPKKPVEAAPPSLVDHAKACAIVAACGDALLPADGAWDAPTRGQVLRGCMPPHSEEEALIAIGSVDDTYPATNERWSWWVPRAIAMGGCGALDLWTVRPSGVACDQYGCTGHATFACMGAVASSGDAGGAPDVGGLEVGADAETDAASDAGIDVGTDVGTDVGIEVGPSGTGASRDCSHVFESCSASSGTGCEDRAPVACDANTLAACDGQVVVGCDSTAHAYLADCSRYPGGVCVQDELGARCSYPASTTCALPSCDGAKLRICMATGTIEVDCLALGLAACVPSSEGAACGSPLPVSTTP